MSKSKWSKSSDRCVQRHFGWMRFNEPGPEQWSMTDPDYEPLHEAAHTARYSLANLTQTQAYILCSAFESYHHLMTHPCGTEYAISQLRAVRRALAEEVPDTTPKKEPDGKT